MIRAYHEAQGDHERNEILVPNAAHGTNPATAVMCGYKVAEVPVDASGDVDTEALRAAVGPQTAGLMMTNPSTCGVFERRIGEIAAVVHDAGGLLYYDGANLNAILGKVKPGDMGFDVLHMNLHKTFATPHGGGGPGAGPVGVGETRYRGHRRDRCRRGTRCPSWFANWLPAYRAPSCASSWPAWDLLGRWRTIGLPSWGSPRSPFSWGHHRGPSQRRLWGTRRWVDRS